MSTVLAPRKFRQISLEGLRKIPTPLNTDTWQPVQHGWLVDEMVSHLREANLRVESQDLRVSQNGLEFFGILNLQDQSTGNSKFNISCGLRNTNNKRASAGICLGKTVLVCSNLDFSSDHTFLRKHYRKVYDEMSKAMGPMVAKIAAFNTREATKVENLQSYILPNPEEVHDIVIRALDAKAITTGEIPKVLDFYRFGSQDSDLVGVGRRLEPTAWRLFNSFTWVAKERFAKNPETAAFRSIALNRVFDKVLTGE